MSEERILTPVQAVKDALDVMMKSDENVVMLGEDVGVNGGVFRATDGLIDTYGEKRVMDTPLSEAGIVGAAIGMAMNGMKPVAEIQFFGFIYPAFEQIMTQATRMRYRTMSKFTVPMVIRAPYGAGVHAPEIHSDSMEALFTHMPGIKVVCPSTAYDTKGLLISAIEDPDPVLFLESLKLYRGTKDHVPEEKYTVEIGKGYLAEEGEDVTLIAWGAMMKVALKAAEQAREKGITCDVIDLRTLYPIDKDIIAASVQKTNRCVIVHEAQQTGGLSNDIIRIINDTSFLYLKSPVSTVTAPDVHVPFWALEKAYLPTPERVMDKIQYVMDF